MKQLRLFALIIFSISLFASCGKKEGTTQLRVSLGAVTGSANFPGGLYIWGSNDALGIKFIEKVPAGDELILELDNGTWSFAAVGWGGDDSAAYAGSVYCDSNQSVNLTGADFNLALNATQAKCAGFTDPAAIVAGGLAPLKFYSCLDVKPHLQLGDSVEASMDCQGGGDGGGPGPGGDQSFKISLITKSATGVVGEGLLSSCVNLGSASNFVLPTGNANIQMPFRVRAYSGAGCTGTETQYVFSNGLSDGSTAVDLLGQTAIDPGVSVNLYLHVDICSGGQLASTAGSPFAATMGTSNDYHLICTAEQFTKIGTNGTSQHTFELAQDIDFAGLDDTSLSTFAYVSTPFGGEVRGQYKKVKNGDRALFDIIEAPSASNEWSYTGNIIFDNFVINQTATSSYQSFGIFANKYRNYSSSSDIEVGDIFFDRFSSLTVSGNFAIYVGAFTGLAEHTGSARSYIRKVQSLADVKLQSNTNPGSYVGGIVGKAYSQGSGNDSRLSLEMNEVGKIYIPYLNVSDSKQVVVQGYKNVGGIAGSVYGAEMWGLHKTYVSMSAAGDAGGIIGSMDINTNGNSNNLAGFEADLTFSPTLASTYYVGGIVGHINQSVSNNTFIMAAANADVTINDNGNTLHYFGGLVGKYYTSGYSDLKIVNSRANLDVTIDGDYQGGLVGYYYPVYTNPGFDFFSVPAISYSLAQGYLGGTSTSGTHRGGLVGYGKDADIYRSVANINVSGSGRLGGVYGTSDDSILHEDYVSGIVKATGTSSSSTFVGGVAGELLITSNNWENFARISKVDVDIQYPNVDISTCAQASCGLVVGNLSNNTSSSLTFASIAMGTISDSVGNLAYETCGSIYGGGTACPPNFGTSPRDFNGQSSATTMACTALTGAPFDDANGYCTPLFEQRWMEYGHDAANTNYEYLAGNQLEPFVLMDAADWNGLSDDSFLMAKSYVLGDNINFGGGAPTPIGSEQEPFKGAIFAEGFSLNNISFSAGPGSPGIITYMEEGGMLGRYGSPFIVNSLDLDCGSESGCGFIGQIIPSSFGGGDTEIAARVNGGAVYGGSDCMGGIVGRAGASVRFESSSYSGYVNSTGGAGVGGFIGCVGMASGNSFSSWSYDMRVNIYDSYADLSYISGTDYVGGFIGNMESTSSRSTYLEARYTYVVLDKNNSHAGDDIVGSNHVAGMVGGVDLDTNGYFQIEGSYVDTSTAQVPNNYRHFASASFGSYDPMNDSFYDNAIIWNSSASSASSFYGFVSNNSGLSFTATSVADLTTNGPGDFEVHDGGHSDWWIDPNDTRVLKLWWENPNAPADY